LSTAAITPDPVTLNEISLSAFGQMIPFSSTIYAVTYVRSSQLFVIFDLSAVRRILAGLPAVLSSSEATSFPLFLPTAFRVPFSKVTSQVLGESSPGFIFAPLDFPFRNNSTSSQLL
jgi:hypothetical protein